MLVGYSYYIWIMKLFYNCELICEDMNFIKLVIFILIIIMLIVLVYYNDYYSVVIF